MSFVLGGTTADALGLILLSRVVPVMPPTRDRTLVMPGRPGEWDFGADFQQRTFTLNCVFHKTQTREEFAQALRDLAAHLSGTDGRPRTLQLIIEPETDRYYYVRYVGSLPVERHATWGQISLSLVAYDPFAYAVTPDVITMLGSPLNHTQRGTAPADPLLRLQGVSLGGAETLTIQIGAQSVAYAGALAVNDWLEIDCAAKTAVRVVGANRTNVLPHLELPVFPQLAPGTNVVAVAAVGGAAWSTLEIHCRNRWL